MLFTSKQPTRNQLQDKTKVSCKLGPKYVKLKLYVSLALSLYVPFGSGRVYSTINAEGSLYSFILLSEILRSIYSNRPLSESAVEKCSSKYGLMYCHLDISRIHPKHCSDDMFWQYWEQGLSINT